MNWLPFAHPGECDLTSDAVFCTEVCPAAWLDRVLLVHNGAVIAETSFEYDPTGTGFGVDIADLAGASLVIADVDGREVEVPLPAVDRPVPTIENVERTPSGLNQDRVDIAWSTAPEAASAVVELGTGFGGPRCHEVGASGVTSHEFGTQHAIQWAYVTAYAPPETFANAMGTVHVWPGAVTTLDLLAE